MIIFTVRIIFYLPIGVLEDENKSSHNNIYLVLYLFAFLWRLCLSLVYGIFISGNKKETKIYLLLVLAVMLESGNAAQHTRGEKRNTVDRFYTLR